MLWEDQCTDKVQAQGTVLESVSPALLQGRKLWAENGIKVADREE